MTTPDFFDFRYPKIQGPRDAPLKQCIGFVKLDGTNLSCPWRRGVGFGPISTRTHVVERDHPALGEAYAVFERIAEKLGSALTKAVAGDEARAFFEFLGKSSFAGMHRVGEEKRLVLIDVGVRAGDGMAIMGPFEFLEAFKNSELDVAEVRYRVKFGGKLEGAIRDGGGYEGIVFKGGVTGSVWMAKVKTKEWEAKLKEAFRDGKWKAADAIERGVDDDA